MTHTSKIQHPIVIVTKSYDTAQPQKTHVSDDVKPLMAVLVQFLCCGSIHCPIFIKAKKKKQENNFFKVLSSDEANICKMHAQSKI